MWGERKAPSQSPISRGTKYPESHCKLSAASPNTLTLTIFTSLNSFLATLNIISTILEPISVSCRSHLNECKIEVFFIWDFRRSPGEDDGSKDSVHVWEWEERAVWSTAWVSWVLYISRLGISPGNDPSSLLVKDILSGMLGWESCEDVGLMTGPGPVYYNLMMLRHSHLADCPA